MDSSTFTLELETELRLEQGVEHAVSFAGSGGALVGVLAEPPDGAPRASRGVVIVHGWGNCRAGPHDMLIKFARALTAAGLPTVRYDMRGRGDSEGAYGETDLDGMIEDCCAAGARLQDWAGCDRLAAAGLCSGGNVVIGAATLDSAYERLVCISTLPFQTHAGAAQRGRRTWAALGGYARKLLRAETWRKLVHGEINFGAVGRVVAGGEPKAVDQAGRNRKDSRRDIVAAFQEYRGEVLFAYGGADGEGEGGRKHYEELCAANGIPARFHVVAGANHNFYGIGWERELVDVSVAFLKEDGMPQG